MGPVGYLLLRIMPYFMRFIYTIMDSGKKLFYILGAGLPNPLVDPSSHIQVKMDKVELNS